jgi:hypothetical protein
MPFEQFALSKSLALSLSLSLSSLLHLPSPHHLRVYMFFPICTRSFIDFGVKQTFSTHDRRRFGRLATLKVKSAGKSTLVYRILVVNSSNHLVSNSFASSLIVASQTARKEHVNCP